MNRTLFPETAEVRPAKSLAVLAYEINTGHAAAEEAARSSLEHARRTGELLHKAKQQCGHGKWIAWLKANVHFSQQTASNYMRVAAEWDKLPTVGNLGIREAVALLAGPRDEAPKGEPSAPQTQRTVAPGGEREAVAAPDSPPAADGVEIAEDRASPGDIAREGEEPGKPGEYVTLAQWNALDPGERQALLHPADAGKEFNNQGATEGIDWARWSWNPVTGCEHNCPYCYARDIAERFYEQGFKASFWPERLHAPRNTRFPAGKAKKDSSWGNVFVCSMADLFGRWVPREWIDAVLDAVAAAPQWTFLFLTKFPIRMAEFDFPENTWVGTTVDCQARVANAEKAFRKIKAGVKWLSLEPLLQPLMFRDLGAFQWIVLGGASKSTQTPEWHPPRPWVLALEAEAARLGIPFYEKPNLAPPPLCAFPGMAVPTEPDAAPMELCYLPSPKH